MTGYAELLRAAAPAGGGAAAAAYGVLAAGLAKNLCALGAASQEELCLEELTEKLCSLAQADEALLTDLLPLFASGRKIAEADLPLIRRAVELPQQIAAACLETARLCLGLTKLLPPHAVGDLATAAEGANCGLKAAQTVALANLPFLQEAEQKKSLQAMQRTRLQGRALCLEFERLLRESAFYAELYDC